MKILYLYKKRDAHEKIISIISFNQWYSNEDVMVKIYLFDRKRSVSKNKYRGILSQKAANDTWRYSRQEELFTNINETTLFQLLFLPLDKSLSLYKLYVTYSNWANTIETNLPFK